MHKNASKIGKVLYFMNASLEEKGEIAVLKKCKSTAENAKI
jgi:hypothetical protein